ncbi:MAG TPA: hypothetical protein VIX84_04180 [Acidimicrobiales bacterium]
MRASTARRAVVDVAFPQMHAPPAAGSDGQESMVAVAPLFATLVVEDRVCPLSAGNAPRR